MDGMVLHPVPWGSGVNGGPCRCYEGQPKGVRFADFYKVCEHHFGKPRQRGTSHAVFKMPWPGDPRVNIQDDKGKAKPYQVRQVLEAIEKKEGL
jgi:hypothetical protein